MEAQTKPFIDEKKIFDLLEKAKQADKREALDVVTKSRELHGLSLYELAVLLQTDDPEVVEHIYSAALDVKQRIYGKRMVFFAPLYLSNVCANNCLYCGFRRDNKDLVRKVLNEQEIEEEVKILLEEGHKRLLLVFGEALRISGIEYMEKAIDIVYATRVGDANIRRVNVNCAPLSVEDFKRLKACGIGTYQCFQETYHTDTYKIMHPSGPKADYNWRVFAPDRAMQAGIDDVGIGPLFGLFDYKFDMLATLMHAEHLDKTYGVGPHTISIPRLEPALNAPVANDPPHAVTDDDMKRIVALLRLAVPYTGIILSTRERPELRDELFALGVSQTSAGSRTSPGGYKAAKAHAPEKEQFSIGDTRGLAELCETMCESGYIPSFCTACYRKHRTGESFMALAKHGEIHKMCQPNAILSLKEYLLDYGHGKTLENGNRIIDEMLSELEPKLQKKTREMLAKIEAGERDIYL